METPAELVVVANSRTITREIVRLLDENRSGGFLILSEAIDMILSSYWIKEDAACPFMEGLSNRIDERYDQYLDTYGLTESDEASAFFDAFYHGVLFLASLFDTVFRPVKNYFRNNDYVCFHGFLGEDIIVRFEKQSGFSLDGTEQHPRPSYTGAL